MNELFVIRSLMGRDKWLYFSRKRNDANNCYWSPELCNSRFYLMLTDAENTLNNLGLITKEGTEIRRVKIILGGLA